jgi:hypothetical protein
VEKGANLMIKKPVAIIVGVILLFAGLFRCDAFSQETPIPEPSLSEQPRIGVPSTKPKIFTASLKNISLLFQSLLHHVFQEEQ